MGRNLTSLYISSSFQFLTQVSGSELQDGLGNKITGSLEITSSKADTATSASFATNSTSASFSVNAISASFATNATSASFATTANTANTATTASYVANAVSSSYALTASFAANANFNTGSLMKTGSVTNNVLTFTKGDGSTFSLTVATGSAVSASYADTASVALLNVLTASSTNDTITYTKGNGTTFTNVINNVSASISASFAVNAGTATSSSFSTTAASATSASTAATAVSASFASTIANGLNVTFGNITASNANFTNLTATSASFGYVRTTTGSAVVIGDEFIILNADTPAAPFAGIKVYDTGSASTASIEWNGNTDTWITVEENGASAMILTGLSGSKGTEVAPALNKLLKGTGNNTVANSNITDNGSLVTIASNTVITGSVNVTGSDVTLAQGSNLVTHHVKAAAVNGVEILNNSSGVVSLFGAGGSLGTTFYGQVNGTVFSGSFSGSLNGNATTATTASYATQALSASYAPAGNPFPFTGNAYITGSLKGVGPIWFPSEATTGSNSGFPNTTNIILGGHNHTLNMGDSFHVILGAPSSTMIGSGNNNGLIAGSSNSLSGGNQCVIVGGVSNALSGGDRSGIFAGHLNSLNGGWSAILAGYSNTISGNPSYTAILSGFGNTVASNYGVIVGGSGSTANQTNAVLIGLNNFTSSAANTVYVSNLYATGSATVKENLTVSGSLTTVGNSIFTGSVRGEVDALSISSNTASLDLSTGNFFTLTLVSGSNTYVNPTNIQPGQTINLRITQPSPGTGSISFPSSVKQVSGSAYVPTAATSSVDVVTFISFDSSNLYLSNIKNFV